MRNMKQIIISITAAGFFSLCGLIALGQQPQEKKTKIDESSKTTDKMAAATVKLRPVAESNELKAEQPKPIVPGGEFKPMDTNRPPAKTAIPETVKTEPVLPAQQKAGPPPVVTEQPPAPSAQAPQPAVLKPQQ